MSLPKHKFPLQQYNEEIGAYQMPSFESSNTYQLTLPTMLEQEQPATILTKNNTALKNFLSDEKPLRPIPNCSKVKRIRTSFNPTQIDQLELEFKRNRYIHRVSRSKIAKRLSISEKNVKIWFQNRRTKYKKEHQTCEGSSSTKALLPNVKQNVHKDIVQRLMSYTQDQTEYKTSCSMALPETLATTNQNQMPSDLNVLIQQLIENSPENSQHSLDSLVDPAFFKEMEIQPLQQVFDTSTHAFKNENYCWKNTFSAVQNEMPSPQLYQYYERTANVLTTAATTPSINLIWGDPDKGNSFK